jgi:hypothetical protein
MLVGWIIFYIGLLGLGVSLALVFWCYYPKSVKLKVSKETRKIEPVKAKEIEEFKTKNVEINDNETELLDGIYSDDTELLEGVQGDDTELLGEEL